MDTYEIQELIDKDIPSMEVTEKSRENIRGLLKRVKQQLGLVDIYEVRLLKNELVDQEKCLTRSELIDYAYRVFKKPLK